MLRSKNTKYINRIAEIYYRYRLLTQENCILNNFIIYLVVNTRGGTTLCTRHAYSKYIIDNRMFTIQFENGFRSENISLKKILKLNVNLSSCLNLFSIWDLLKCMIAILVYKYCQQYLYKKVYKYCYSLPLNSWTLLIMIIFLFCYGVLMKLCFYLKNHN